MEEAKNRTGVVRTLRAEFKKIVWPDRKTAGRQTLTVITLSVIIGVIIGILDTVIKFLVGIII